MKTYFRIALILTLITILSTLFIGMQAPFTFVVLPFLLVLGFCLLKINQLIKEKVNFYEQIIDAFPQPISVTNMEMKWTFVNKAATEPLGVTRSDVLGQHCSNWGANICGTEDCGVNCLRRNEPTSFF
jgi:methyl-accepting chemotaxis protein